LKKVKAAPIFDEMIFGASLSIIVSLIVTFFWKISIHMIGIGGLTGIVYVTIQYLAPGSNLIVAGLILIAGLVAFARIKLQAHNSMQVLVGYVVGFVCTYLPLWWDFAN
jgi:membrane-associated phospholipid phosphatase